MQKLGQWAFIGGLAIAVLAGLGVEAAWFIWILALLGLIVGLMNVTGEETQRFLLAAIGLILSATAVRALPYLGDLVTRIMEYVVLFIAPAVLIVALKALLQTAKEA